MFFFYPQSDLVLMCLLIRFFFYPLTNYFYRLSDLMLMCLLIRFAFFIPLPITFTPLRSSLDVFINSICFLYPLTDYQVQDWFLKINPGLVEEFLGRCHSVIGTTHKEETVFTFLVTQVFKHFYPFLEQLASLVFKS